LAAGRDKDASTRRRSLVEPGWSVEAIQTVGISESAITLPDADETAVKALDKYRNGTSADELDAAKTEIERLRATVAHLAAAVHLGEDPSRTG
jgi:hypothetical protein